MTLYGRRVQVDIAGLTITKPRISGQIERHADSTQTRGGVNIYNLSPYNADRIYERSAEMRVQAGYDVTFATIFEGQAQRISRPRQDLAHITHIAVGDRTRAPTLLGGVTARAYSGPVRVFEIVTDIVLEDLKLGLGPLTAIDLSWTITNFTWTGRSIDALTTVLRRFDVRWFEDDGLIRVRKVGEPQSDASTVSVSPRTGLIGAPHATDEGAEAVTFLNPQLKVGGIFELESVTLSGAYRIVALRHDFDNWQGSPFQTYVDLREM